uniref:hypothetical protein n=1 Tax=Vibrio cholerae TaxID=666 RepID=UPI003F5896FC
MKAERIEKDEQGNITTIFCSYDPETLGKNPADGRKVKVLFTGYLLKKAFLRSFVSMNVCSLYPIQVRRITLLKPLTQNLW